MDQSKSSLSTCRQRLLEIMQQLHFGKIENLVVLHGDPVFSPPPTITQEIKLGPESAPRSGPNQIDFALKSHVIDLFNHMERLRDGSLVTIECRHGLPTRLIVERSV